MVLLNIVTRCYETEAPLYWLARELSEQLVQSFWGTAHSSWPYSSTAEPLYNTRACDHSRELLGSGWATAWDLFLCSSAASPGRPGAAPAECSSGWHLGSQMFSRYSAVHKLRRGLVILSVRYFSEYTAIFSLCLCIHMNMMVSFHYNKKLFPKYFFYNIHVETMSLTWRRHLSHEHLCV